MAFNALVISNWLCACIKHWLDRWTDIYCVSILFLTLNVRMVRMDRKRILFPVVFIFVVVVVFFDTK